MTQAVGSETSLAKSPQTRWRRFEANVPPPHEIVAIRRFHDDKTVLRARSELPPSFDWRRAEWRPL